MSTLILLKRAIVSKNTLQQAKMIVIADQGLDYWEKFLFSLKEEVQFLDYFFCSLSDSMRKRVLDIKIDPDSVCLLELNEKNCEQAFLYLNHLKQNKVFTVVMSQKPVQELVRNAYFLGADEFITYPLEPDDFQYILRRREFSRKFQLSKKEKTLEICPFDVLTRDENYQRQLLSLYDCVMTDLPIMLQGETGTGKTFLAKKIHHFSHRSQGPFIHLNCSEMSDSLLESELFGHQKGSFSGAVYNKKGKIELAHMGTLFLDELGSAPPNVQIKLLKAIEEKSFYPVGGEELIFSNFRLISATCDDLKEMVKNGDFREDLYFRLFGHGITIKPLRKRRDDIKLLIQELLNESIRKMVFSEDALECLIRYDWPGNIRELSKVLTQMIAKSKGLIQKEDLPEHIIKNKHPLGLEVKETDATSMGLISPVHLEKVKNKGLKSLLEEIENELVAYFLETNHGKIRKTMGALGVSNSTFYRVLDRIGSERK